MPSRPVPSTARRARRVIDSTSPSPSPSPSLNDDEPSPPVLRRGTKRSLAVRDDDDDDDDDEEEDEDEDAEGEEEEDAEGEDVLESEEEGEGERGTTAGPSRVSSVIASEDMDIDEEDDDDTPTRSTTTSTPTVTGPAPAPKSALKIKINVPPSASPATVSGSGAGAGPSGGRAVPARSAASNGGKKSKKIKYEDELESEDELILQDDGPDEIEELDVDDDEEEGDDLLSRQSYSPTKMTARQRAKGNKDLQETLLQLPDDMTGKKAVVLTEAEKQQKREEISRRRKRQNDQKLQDEQDQTINRLLRAQTTKSRSKLDSDTIPGDPNTSSNASPSRRLLPSTNNNASRWISSIEEGGENVMIRVAVPKEKESWLDLPLPNRKREQGGQGLGKCAVDGCKEQRKYRSVKKFEVGGCSLIHLKQVEASL